MRYPLRTSTRSKRSILPINWRSRSALKLRVFASEAAEIEPLKEKLTYHEPPLRWDVSGMPTKQLELSLRKMRTGRVKCSPLSLISQTMFSPTQVHQISPSLN